MIRLSRQAFRLSDEPVDPTCDCPVCLHHSRGYLHHLLKGKHRLGTRLVSIHNTHHYQLLMRRAREAILSGTYASFHDQMREMLKNRAHLR